MLTAVSIEAMLFETAGPGIPLTPPDEELMLRESVAGIAGRYGHTYFQECSAAGEPPAALWDELSAGGFVGANLPEEHGGGGLGIGALCAVEEELAAAGCPLPILVISPAIVGSILARHADPEQRERWLAPIAAGTVRAAFAITESDAGSNSHNVATTARRDGAGYRLRGMKTFISGVEDAAVVLVVARTGVDERSGRGQLSLFVVDTDAPGLERQLIPTAVQAPERQWQLFFDDVEVAEDRRIGPEGAGLRALFDGLNPERLMGAAMCTGIARYALDKACAYARERQVWGVPIGSHQGVAHPLAEAMIELEAARLVLERGARRYDAGLDAAQDSNIAKFLASEVSLKALDRAMQTHGGNGLALEYGLADLWFVARLLRTAPVSREMVLNYVAEHTLGLPKSY
jgi:alkylation response protein AidB-like acyl-CoA dehydrogenase